MSKNTTKEQILIFSSAVIVVLISVTAVIAFRHFHQSPLESVIHKRIVNQKPEATVENRPVGSITDIALSPDIHGYEKPSETFREKIPPVRQTDERAWYFFLSHDSEDKENFSMSNISEDTKILRRQASQDESTSVLSVFPGSTSIETALPGKTINYNPQINTLQSRESKSDDLTRDENYKEEEQVSDYTLIVSRDFLSGSFDEGDIYVNLSVLVDSNPPNGLIVEEHIPKGWDVVESSPPYRVFNASSGETKWVFVGMDVESMEINYRVVRRGDATGGASFSGTYLYNSSEGERMTMQIDGMNGA